MSELKSQYNQDNLQISLRDDERSQLRQCRRNALGSGFLFGGLAWLATRFLISNTPLGKTFFGRYPLLAYTIMIGSAFYQGVASTAKSCFRGLANLENSRFSELGKRALQMTEDKKNLSREQYLEKYPHDMQKLFDTTIKSSEAPPPDHAPISDVPQSTPQDMFFPAGDSELRNKPKSFQQLQNENRSRQEASPYHFRDRRPRYDMPRDTTKQLDTDGLPPGAEGKLKAKRNKYGDIVYEE